MNKSIGFILLLLFTVPFIGAAQSRYEYWFDEDYSSVITGSSDTTAFDLSISTDFLSSGFHSIHLQVMDTAGVPASVLTRYFIKVLDTSSGIKRVSYWFDNDTSTIRNISLTGDVIQIPTDSLASGFHAIHVMVGDDHGTPSSVSTRYFIKVLEASSVIKSVHYWFDDDACTTRNISLTGDVIQIPTDSLASGFHAIHVMVGDDHGTPSSVSTRYFIKTHKAISSSRMFYSIDNGSRTEVTDNLTDGVCDIELDMSSLNDGLHTFTYYLADEDEITSSIRTGLFWKNPFNEAPVVEYCYWINDDEETRTVVQNTDFSNPFMMDTLLYVESKPFRSSCFYFYVDNGKPAACAKNDINFQVKNAAGRTAQENSSFTDINVRYPIDSIIHLKNGDVYTTDSPGENEILWYDFNAVADDIISLRVDTESTMQLFSPIGTELLNISGPDVKTTQTVTVHENGRYYIAIHDVIDSYSVTLEFNKTDAYGFNHAESIFADDSIEIILGDVINLYDVITVLPLESTNKTVDASPENEQIVKIQKNGDEIIDITGIGIGITNITVFSNDNPEATKTIKVKVVEQDIRIGYDGRFISFLNNSGTLHYTLDGSIPNSESMAATGKIDVNGLTQVKAIVINNGYESPLHAYSIDYYYDGATALTAQSGVLAKAFEWCGLDSVRNLKVDGVMDSTDFETVRYLKELRILDLSKCTVVGNELTDSILRGCNMLAVELPDNIERVGNGLFARCVNLASIIWNSDIDIPQNALDGILNPNLLLYVSDASQAVRTGITNVVVNGVAQRITLSDNILSDGSRGNSNFYCPRSFRVLNEITYTHIYTQRTLIGDCGGWETIALPFDVQNIRHKDKGEIVPFGQSPTGKRQFWLCSLLDNEFVDTDSIRANTPYLISMPNNEEYSPIYCLDGEVTFSSRRVVVPVSEPVNTGNQSSTFIPCFEHKDKSTSIYTINVGEELWDNAPGSLFLKDYRDVYPFEGYRLVSSQNVQHIQIRRELKSGANKVHIPRMQESKGLKYNVQGIPIEDVEKRGLYIQGGRLFFSK